MLSQLQKRCHVCVSSRSSPKVLVPSLVLSPPSRSLLPELLILLPPGSTAMMLKYLGRVTIPLKHAWCVETLSNDMGVNVLLPFVTERFFCEYVGFRK